jgi:hypothetical protein
LLTGIRLRLPDGPYEPVLTALDSQAALGASLLLVNDGPEQAKLQKFMEAMVESRQTWNYSTLVRVPLRGEDAIESCADRLRQLREIPGVHGAFFDAAADVSAIPEIVRSAAL